MRGTLWRPATAAVVEYQRHAHGPSLVASLSGLAAATSSDVTLTIDTNAAPAWPMQPVRLNRRERRRRRFAR